MVISYISVQKKERKCLSINASLRSRRECVPARTSVPNVPARTSVPNASAKSLAGREKNGGESNFAPGFAARENSLAVEAREGISGFAAKSFARVPTLASYAG